MQGQRSSGRRGATATQVLKKADGGREKALGLWRLQRWRLGAPGAHIGLAGVLGGILALVLTRVTDEVRMQMQKQKDQHIKQGHKIWNI